MRYCTEADLISRFGERELIALSAPGQSTVNSAVIDQAIVDASSLIDTYLAGRYQLPLSQVPTVLTRTACSIARYYLYNDQTTDAVEQAHKDATRYLMDVSKGLVSIGTSTLGESAVQSDNLVEMSSDSPVWSRKQSTTFI